MLSSKSILNSSAKYRLKLPKKIILKGQLNLKCYSTSEDKSFYDIIIVGGGAIGTTLACTLGKNNNFSDKKILLLEAVSKKPWSLPEKYSKRVSMLSPGSRKLLKSIDVWKYVANGRFSTVKRMQVWDGLSDAFITFGNDNLDKDLGYVIENDIVLNGSTEEANKLENVQINYGVKIKNYKLSDKVDKENSVFLKDGSVLKCKLLLGCDGPNSQVRKTMEAINLSWNYVQSSIVATLELDEETENVVAWQRMLPNGPIALLPLSNKLSSLVWSTSRSEAKQLLSLSNEEFVKAVNDAWTKSFEVNKFVEEGSKAFNTLLSKLPLTSKFQRQCPPVIIRCEESSRAAFPLGFGHATNYVKSGVAILGDAAHKVHPLAGQGVNLGYGDIVVLNKHLTEAVSNGSDIDDILYLREYESERQLHNVPAMLVIDGLNRLYSTNFAPVVLVRSMGLQVTQALQPLKNIINNFASS